MLVNGECRYLGSVLVGLKTIEAKIFNYSGENMAGEILVDQIMDNVTRKDMDPVETLQSFKRAIDLGISIEDLAKAFGVSVDVIEKDLPILGLPEKLLGLYDKGKMSKAVARKIAEFPSGKRMLKAWEWAQSGKNTKGMLAKIEAYAVESSQITIDPIKDAAKGADSKDRQAARKTFGKLMKMMGDFEKSKFSNGSGVYMVEVNKKNIDEMAAVAKAMEKYGKKIMDDIRIFQASSKHSAA